MKVKTKKLNITKVLGLIAIVFIGNCVDHNENLSVLDAEKIRNVRLTYNQGWLESDSSMVLSTLHQNSVLIPHHGDEQVSGLDSIRSFWWPNDSEPSQVTVFESDIYEISGNSNLAYIRGRFKLHYTYADKLYKNEGNFLNLLNKVNGEWKLSRLVWTDPIPDIEE